MSDSKPNTTSSSQDAYWASRFVPLPPTQFPEDEILGGCDPFVNPELLENTATINRPTETETGGNMEVEIIGQIDHEPTASDRHLAPAPTDVRPTIENSPSDETHPQDAENQSGEIGVSVKAEVSLANQFSPTEFVSTSLANANKNARSTKNEDVVDRPLKDQETSESDAFSYWAQFSTSNFVPGLTPIEAYPVCTDFKEKFSDPSPPPETAPPAYRQFADTDYFFLAGENADEATDEPSAKLNNDQQAELENAPVADASPLPAAGEPEPSDAINVTDFLPQLPTSTSSTGERLIESVENTLTELHQSFADQLDSQPSFSTSTEPAEPPTVVSEVQPQPALSASALSVETQADPIDAQVEKPTEAPAPDEAPENSPEVGQVIQVDGDDGYDFLDLKSFQPEQATFSHGQILLDAGTSTIQIDHKNIGLAIFANDVEIALR